MFYISSQGEGGLGDVFERDSGEYQYQSEELQTLSEEANLNLEIGLVDQEEPEYFDNEEKIFIVSQEDAIQNGEIIWNRDNESEWLAQVGISMSEEEQEYAIWKEDIGSLETPYQELGRLTNIAYERWEYRSEGAESLQGVFVIGTVGAEGLPGEILYRFEQ